MSRREEANMAVEFQVADFRQEWFTDGNGRSSFQVISRNVPGTVERQYLLIVSKEVSF